MEFRTYSKKQAGVIYRNYKEGKLELTQEQIRTLYDYAEYVYCGYPAARQEAEEISLKVKSAIDSIFAGNIEDAQNSLNLALA